MSDEVRYNGYTADEWEAMAEPPAAATNEELTNLGIIEQQPQQQSQETQAQPQANQPKEREYEKLGYFQTLEDEAIAGATEFTKFFLPKSMELNYTPRTRAGAAFQKLTKYVYGIDGLLAGGAVSGGLKATALANKAPKAAKFFGGIESLLGSNPLFKTGKGGLKAVGVKGLNLVTQGLSQQAILDATIHTSDEGRFADIFGETNNDFIKWLQTDENDSTAEAKLKNVVDGALVNIGINGVASVASPILTRFLKNIKKAKVAETAGKEISEEVSKELTEDTVKLQKMTNTADLIDTVRGIKEEADALGEDASQLVAERLHVDDVINGQAILENINKGEDFFLRDDGTWDIKVNNWEDAYKVTPEVYNEQLLANDAEMRRNGTPLRDGDTAIQHSDEAIKQTWINRNLLESNNPTLTKDSVRRIVNHYKDKWQIDNNIKVEFMDGVRSKTTKDLVDGSTDQTTFLGKNKKPTKAAQTKIDKKELEIQQLQDKITQLEGGNAEVSDPLDILKEKLRIAENELKDLKKIPQPEKISNITIKIDKNAKNPYATLRAELEHARDFAKETVPDQATQHFSRYEGMNEGEVAAGYTHKKSVGRNNALNPDEASITPTETKEIKATTEETVNETVENTTVNSDTVKNTTEATINAEPKQLTLDFSTATTPDEVVNTTITQGAKTVDDVKAFVDKTIELNPEISGATWEAIAADSQKFADFLVECDKQGMVDTLKEAINMNDITKMNQITRKVLGFQYVSSTLGDKLAQLGADPPMEQLTAVMDLIQQIGIYTKETGSAAGAMLQARKLINRAIETFGSLRLSQVTKSGIQELSDLLSADIKNELSLNFTRGEKLSNEQIKVNLLNRWLANTDSEFVQLVMNDKEIAKEFNDILDKALRTKGNIDLAKEIEYAIMKADYKTAYEATKLTSNPETKATVIQKFKDFVNSNGGVTSYYVHNLLSGVDTLVRNIVSGGKNALYFPTEKIVAGVINDLLKPIFGFEGGEALRAEGWNTYMNLASNWKESWALCKEAFINGEGKLSIMKDTMALGEDEVFTGFREWKFDLSTPEGAWHAIQNFHSIMTRAMGASDEFMSQLNYRSIMRAKSLKQAQDLASQFGIKKDEEILALADRYFASAFDNSGRPLNLEALAEAKDILYQLPLNGKMKDPVTGLMKQVRPESFATELGGFFQKAGAKSPFMKVMFPFVKTGTNILQQNLEHNALYCVLSPAQRDLLKANTKEGALARARVAFGMFSFLTAAAFTLTGMVTGSAPSDKEERAALFATGWKPYSLRIGGKYISYQGYEPLQTILGFAADSIYTGAYIATSEDEKKWQNLTHQVMTIAVNNFLDKAAFRTGLTQLDFLTNPEQIDGLAKSLGQTASGFLPDASMVKGLSTAGGRDATQPEGYQRIFNNYFNKGLGDYRRDAFGNRQDIFNVLLTTSSTDNWDLPEYAELEKLAQYGFEPTDISKTIQGTTLKYKTFKDPSTGKSVYNAMQEELSQLTINGKTLQEAVRDLVTSEEYQDKQLGVNINGKKFDLSSDTKLNAIKAIFADYNDAALNNVIENYGDVFVDKNNRTMDEAVEQVELEKLNNSINQGLNHNLIDKLRRF